MRWNPNISVRMIERPQLGARDIRSSGKNHEVLTTRLRADQLDLYPPDRKPGRKPPKYAGLVYAFHFRTTTIGDEQVDYLVLAGEVILRQSSDPTGRRTDVGS